MCEGNALKANVEEVQADDVELAIKSQAANPQDGAVDASSRKDASKPAGSAPVTFSVILYAVCSSTLLVINKVAVHYVQDASFVLLCQLVASALFVRILRAAQPGTDIELLTWAKAKPFFLASLIFYICLFTNTRALKSVNVETVIVVRSCSPIAVALLETAVFQNPLPNRYGMGALLMLAGGAVLYVVTDAGFQVDGYFWLGLYFVSIVIEMVFVKFIVETIPMSTWTRVYYNNTLSIPLAVMSCALEGFRFLHATWGPAALLSLWLSCIVGVAISYAGFSLRKLVSATMFTVVGVVCKLVTVLINDCIWTQHSNAWGHLGLGICIFAGWLYQKSKSM